VNFCDHKGLNMPTMRVTWEAKNQLKELLVGCGFPEECFLPQEYNFSGPDPKLDMVVALLAMGKNDYKGIVSWGFPMDQGVQLCRARSQAGHGRCSPSHG
jgi:hypothetical protein